MIAHKFAFLCSVSALALTTACSSPMPRNDMPRSAPGTSSSNSAVQYGYVNSIDLVPVQSRTSGGGAVLGAVLGAVIGNQIGSGSGRAVATGAGAIGGGVLGNEVEKRRTSESDIYRITVRYDNGSSAQFDYQRIDDLRVGDRIKVEAGQLHRV